ncbi:MAG: S8 family serine peptidase [Marinobacter sp.]|uniref:S8 family serine peptidase n=1 Tax=Marinobacter sp. TaxID=50741 RepID=UPI00299DAEFA|nr:S8 family serine peptidase [Marinobacter sp.]MDX1755693.1 S8 family serine peptidase [Marinobacter sp.]
MKRSAVIGLLVAGVAVSAMNTMAKPLERDRYIVVLNPDAGPPAAVAEAVARSHNGRVGFVYQHAIQGFSILLPPQALPGLHRDGRIKYVESDDPVQLFSQLTPTGIDRSYDPDTSSSDAAGLSINGIDDYRVDVDVAIIDTGIDYQHPDLNVVAGTNCTYLSGGGPPWMRNAYCVDGLAEGDDDHYHGTHVGGSVGALDNGIGVVGVAPGARLWAVKVLDSSGSGYESNIVAGIDWVVSKAGEIEVANMSLGGAGHSQAEQDAITSAYDAGVVVVVAAGNNNDNAANYSPAGLDNVVTVSALADFDGRSGGSSASTCRDDQDDTLADFSNWGNSVDIAAPGVCITSTYPIEKGEYGTISGTSMASPHVAGGAALLASGNAPTNGGQVDNLVSTLISSGNFNWTDDSGDGVLEPLLEVTNFQPTLVAGGGGSGGDTSNTAPTASFTYSCNELACGFDAGGSNDSDGTLTRYDWDFGDGTLASGVNASHTYATDGTYTVTLTVTDDDSSTDTDVQEVTVSSAASGDFNLTASGYKVKGLQKADLAWSGADGANVDVYRDGALITTTVNDTGHTDPIDQRGGGDYRYQLCEAGTSTCSNESLVTF